MKGTKRGQAVVELVVVVPLLLLLLLAGIDLGRYMHDAIEAGNAARAAVQYGAQSITTSSDSNGMSVAAQNDASDISNLSVTTSNYCTCDSAPGTKYQGCSGMPACTLNDHTDVYVQVLVSKTFAPLIAYPGIPSPIIVSRTAIQQVTP